MDSGSSSNTEEDSRECSLLSLPTELIVLVLTYVDAKYVSSTVSQVCRKLRSIVTDEAFWKNRICSRWPKPYPVQSDTFDWRCACIAREDMHRSWSRHEVNMTEMLVSISFASIDAIHFAQEGAVLAVGCRDHNIFAYDTRMLLETGCPKEALLFMSDAHKGWVWSMSSYGRQLCSCSWDGHVMTWDMASGQRALDFKCSGAVLCTSFTNENEILAGVYNKRVYRFDLRMQGYMQMPRRHSRPVLCLTSDETWVISGSEDGTIVVTDRRNAKVSSTVKLTSYPTSFSYGGGLLYVGCQDGRIELFASTLSGELERIDVFNKDLTHGRQVTSVFHTAGAVFSSSKDKTCKVWEPSLQADIMASIDCGAEISKMHFANGILGLACCDGSLRLHHTLPGP